MLAYYIVIKVCGSAQCPTQCHHRIIYNYQSINDHLQLSYDVIPDFRSRCPQLGWYSVVSIQLDFISIFSPKSLIIFVADVLSSYTIQMYKFGQKIKNHSTPSLRFECWNCQSWSRSGHKFEFLLLVSSSVVLVLRFWSCLHQCQ